MRGGKGRLRLLLLFALSLLPLLLRAQNALVLIQHDRAGPNLPSSDYVFAEWILWPEDQAGRNNRILSLAAGLNLQADVADMGFDAVDGEGQASRNAVRLLARGFFEARGRNVGDVPTAVVANPRGATSSSVRFLALDAPDRIVRSVRSDSPLPRNGLIVYEAAAWDDAVALSKRVAGRTLIVEYPPDGTDRWSRYWLRGPWPGGVPVEKGLGIPGLVHGRSALALLLRPQAFVWQATDAGRWGGPNRWLEHGREAARGVLFVWFGLAAFVIAWAIAQVMNEDRGPFVSELSILTALSPSALVVAGAMARIGGIDDWPLWIALAFVALYGASAIAGFVTRRTGTEAHPLWPVSLVGLGTTALLDPVWSDLSGRFGRWELDVPSLALGAFVAYLSGAMAFAPNRPFGRALAAATLLWGAAGDPWWVHGHSSMLLFPAIALLASEGLFRLSLLVPLVALPTGLLHFAQSGVAWNPDDLLTVASERNATNLWRSALFLLSPLWIGSVCFAAALGLVGNRFLAYRLRQLWRQDPRLRALPWVSISTLALGVTEPLALPAAPVVALGALLTFAYDGLRANA